jgi:hypothetical protein
MSHRTGDPRHPSFFKPQNKPPPPPSYRKSEPWGNRFDAPELRLGVEACRLVGLDPDQLSLQAPFPRRLAGANEAWLENRGRIARFCAR